MRPPDDLIAAIATPIGEGGIAVIRMSGKGAIPAADRFFRGKGLLADVPSHTIHFGLFCAMNGEPLDEVVASVFRSPHSYTGEDVVEISCHGGALLSRRILHELVSGGARTADPGEFTRRAFMNGRIDLSQAEAVAGMIHARSEAFLRTSLSQLRGRLSGHIAGIREGLLHLCGLLEIELDFAEENAIFISREEIEKSILKTISLLDNLLEGYDKGRLYREGVKIVLLGRPNVGKSSILNSLLNEERAIVTELPGTTRDTIEESFRIQGIACRLIDTAGIRESRDIIEAEGIQRTMNELTSADIILLVLSATEAAGEDDVDLFGKMEAGRSDLERRSILVLNKIDLARTTPGVILSERFGGPVYVSAKTGEGMDALRQAIYHKAIGSDHGVPESDVALTNERQKNCVVKGKDSLANALEAVRIGMSEEFIALDIRKATDALGEIIGSVRSEDVLDSIFSTFCIGK